MHYIGTEITKTFNNNMYKTSERGYIARSTNTSIYIFYKRAKFLKNWFSCT